MYGVAPIAAVLALVYVVSRHRAIQTIFHVALAIVVLCNASMLAAGSWRLAMINPYQSDRADPYERIFLPATLVALLAPVVKAARTSPKVPDPPDTPRT